MKRREIVLKVSDHKETKIIPYQIDLTEDSRRRLQNYYGRDNIDNKIIGN